MGVVFPFFFPKEGDLLVLAVPGFGTFHCCPASGQGDAQCHHHRDQQSPMDGTDPVAQVSRKRPFPLSLGKGGKGKEFFREEKHIASSW